MTQLLFTLLFSGSVISVFLHLHITTFLISIALLPLNSHVNLNPSNLHSRFPSLVFRPPLQLFLFPQQPPYMDKAISLHSSTSLISLWSRQYGSVQPVYLATTSHLPLLHSSTGASSWQSQFTQCPPFYVNNLCSFILTFVGSCKFYQIRKKILAYLLFLFQSSNKKEVCK